MMADADKSVQEIAAEAPGAVSAFEIYGLDYCQPTRTSLRTACEERGLKIEDMLARIEAGKPDRVRSQIYAEWSNKPLPDLISDIVTRHHAFTRRELDRASQLFEEAAATKSRQRRRVRRVGKLFDALRQKLAQHMSFEEQVAFPYIVAVERAIQRGERLPLAAFPTIQRPVRLMLLDHDAAADMFRRLRGASAASNFSNSQLRSCRDIESVMAILDEDFDVHVFIENVILFPRAVNRESLAKEPWPTQKAQ